jgi:hypothetical protein
LSLAKVFVARIGRRLRYREDVTHAQNITPTLGDDILRGADDIAAFLYGDARHRRKVYNLVETDRLPHFRLGSTVCARKSVLLSWIKLQEKLEAAASAT